MINPMSLENRNILVTGASSGIGRETAIHLSRLGATLVLVARNEERLNQTYGLLEKGNHLVVPYDLSNLKEIRSIFDQTAANGMKLDGMVHAAGLGIVLPIQAMNMDKVLEVMTVNYFAFLELVKHYPKSKYSHGGSIVAVSSVSSFAGWRGASAYCGTKGALDSSMRALALELHMKNIRVNTVVPSSIKTPMAEQIEKLGDEETFLKSMEKQPLGLGEPIDVANAIAFLLSDASRFITGTSLVVDGGYLAQ